MQRIALAMIAAAAISLTMWAGVATAAPVWQTLPPPAALPSFDVEGRVTHDGARIWFATFGAGFPVILLHGGDASSDYWGDQIPALLADGRRVIVIDSRGHGRSTLGPRPLDYALMESDVIAVMDALSLDHADVVGWSDGAIIGLIMAMKHPQRVSHVFAFGANMDLHGFNPLGAVSPILPSARAALAADYARISPTPEGYRELARAVLAMQAREPNYSPAELAAIKGPRIGIIDGAHEEFILRQHTEYLARHPRREADHSAGRRSFRPGPGPRRLQCRHDRVPGCGTDAEPSAAGRAGPTGGDDHGARTMTITGGCLCGALRYEAQGEPTFAGFCFCADCRRASGGGSIGFMGYPAAAVRFSGESRRYDSPAFRGGMSNRNFCPTCGGLVFGGVRGESDSHTIYAGSLDDPAAFHPAMVIFNRDRPDWAPLPPGLTVFETMPAQAPG